MIRRLLKSGIPNPDLPNGALTNADNTNQENSMDFKELRKEYETAGFDPADLPEDPIAAFQQWFKAASESCPDPAFEANAMALATSNKDGKVSCRWVLLKGVTEKGIQFFTNYDSDKGQQIASNPHAAATFHWPWLGRQVRMEGSIEKTDRATSEKYFHSRPRGSQIGAMVSRQSSEIGSREQLEQMQAELESKFEGQEIPLPENWGGYHIVPTRVEFWQGRLNRLHDRIVFVQGDQGKWTKKRLAP